MDCLMVIILIATHSFTIKYNMSFTFKAARTVNVHEKLLYINKIIGLLYHWNCVRTILSNPGLQGWPPCFNCNVTHIEQNDLLCKKCISCHKCSVVIQSDKFTNIQFSIFMKTTNIKQQCQKFAGKFVEWDCVWHLFASHEHVHKSLFVILLWLLVFISAWFSFIVGLKSLFSLCDVR